MKLTHEAPSTPRPHACNRRRFVAAALCAGVALGPSLARADLQIVTQQGGPPALPIPVFQETGLPSFTMPMGTSSLVPPPTGGTGGGGGGGSYGGTPVDDVMLGRSWGALAAQNATAIGVNPTAIASTCVLESGCQNLAAVRGGTVSGAYQMTNDTYLADIRSALAQNPSLAGTVDTSLAGKMDPANQAIAAAQDLKNAASALRSAGVPNPTFLDARAYYQWGAGAGPSVAQAPGTASMFDTLSSYYTPAQLAANGISASTTVGQWRQTIINKVGAAATQPVLI